MALPLLLMLNTSRQLVFLRAFMAMKKGPTWHRLMASPLCQYLCYL